MAALCSWFHCFCKSYLYFGKDWNSGCQFESRNCNPDSVVVPIDKLSILVTIAFSYVVFHEKLSLKHEKLSLKSGAGLILIVVGTLALLI